MTSEIEKCSAKVPRLLPVKSYAASRLPEIASLSESVKNQRGLTFGVKSLRERRSCSSFFRKQYGKTNYNDRRNLDPSSVRPPKSKRKRNRKRKPEKLQREIDKRCCKVPMTDSSSISEEKNEPRLLETHLWHAKRFVMTNRWNHRLALHYNGKGHSSMSILKRLPNECVIHDASYWCTCRISGNFDSIVNALTALSHANVLENWMGVDGVLSGCLEHALPIYRRNKFPRELLAFVKALWLPTECGQSLIQLANLTSNSRSVIIWVHCSAFEDVVNELKMTFNDSGDETCEVTSLVGSLRRIEMCGKGTLGILKKIIQPINEFPVSTLWKCAKNDKGTVLKSGQVLGLSVKDPRIVRPIKPFNIEIKNKKKDENEVARDAEDNAEKTKPLDKGGLDKDHAGLFLEQNKHHPHRVSNVSNLRHEMKIASMGLTGGYKMDMKLKEGLQCGDGGNGKLKTSYACCVILIYRKINNVPCWSLIVPSGWCMAFWKELTASGAVGAGIREWNWVGNKLGLLSFPYNFPFTPAYDRTCTELHTQQKIEFSKRAKGKQSAATPYPPQWNDIIPFDSAKNGPSIDMGLYVNYNDDRDSKGGVLDGCCVSVWISVVGKGRCESGAKVFVKRGEADEKLVGFVTSGFVRGTEAFPGGIAICMGSWGMGEIEGLYVVNPGSDARRKAVGRIVNARHLYDLI